MKKLALSFLILPLLVPTQSAQALSVYLNPDNVTEQIWHNVQNAESVEFSASLDASFTYVNEAPFEFSAYTEVATSTDASQEMFGEYAAEWMFSDSHGNESGSGSAILTPENLYYREGQEVWNVLPIEQSLMEEMNYDEVTDEVSEDVVFDLLQQGIVMTEELERERINGVNNWHYGYRIDTNRILDLAMQDAMYDQTELAELKWYLDNFVSLGGEIWINPQTLYPSRISFNAFLDDAEVGTGSLNITINFHSFNQPILVNEPVVPVVTQPVYDEVNRDSDGDGLTDAEEIRWNANPYSTDTDGDGYDDYTEVTNGYDPNGPGAIDSDGDGLRDYHELYRYNTNPNHPDSDGDGYPDGLEIANNYNPNGPGRL